jgi:hypothetical protein
MSTKDIRPRLVDLGRREARGGNKHQDDKKNAFHVGRAS